ncbi:MAG: ATP-dependent DNA helicase RecG [Lachnospiraceae bacterium]|nr:ATP-dependent DNA helicase RecG [Lachnospiraceae bacterium]
MEIREIKGVGPKTEALFHKLHIFTAEDLLSWYPLHYDEYLPPVPIGEACAGGKAAVEGRISRAVSVRRSGARTILTTDIDDPSGRLRLTWYNAPYIRSLLARGSVFIFRGNISLRNGAKVMEHPEIFTLHQYDEKIKTLLPVYGLTRGLGNNAVGKAVKEALSMNLLPAEYLPETFLDETGMLAEEEAFRAVHFPKNKEEALAAVRRLSFDEFFLFILALRTLRSQLLSAENAFPMKLSWDTERMMEGLPFSLTRAQEAAWREIEADLAGERLMSRLIQGDVGSGKTIIAFLAMAMTASNGFQSALMAPTEVLARQHYEKLVKLIADLKLEKLHPVLLTGGLTASRKREALRAIAEGTANAVIGTHALIEDKVSYKALALVVTDEQHRFGVSQRELLLKKGSPPHLMVMSATPIPRTLGIICYGDLDVSVIGELPKNRLPIKNCVVGPSFWGAALRFIAKEAEAGRQAYVICPMIEPAEGMEADNVLDTARRLKKELPSYSIGILHGRMKPAEKNKVMEDFAEGTIQILVSTTVVEVGVDVPNASVMMILGAERFGLAQLHQLRGRVGRGTEQSYCIFMSGQESETVKKRMEILKNSNNGLEIAEKDFELRGPGDLLGIRQSGDALFKIGDPARDRDVIVSAGKLAASLMERDPELAGAEHAPIKKRLDAYMEESSKTITL